MNFLLSENIEAFDLVDECGNSVPYEILSKERALLGVFSPLNLPGVLDAERCVWRFMPKRFRRLRQRFSLRCRTARGA